MATTQTVPRQLARFNPDWAFVARREVLVGEQKIAPGQPVDKTKFTTRKLRQLYEQRWITLDASASNPESLLNWQFAVRKELRVGDEVWSFGEVLDAKRKALFTPERLLQLYDQHYIDRATEEELAAHAAKRSHETRLSPGASSPGQVNAEQPTASQASRGPLSVKHPQNFQKKGAR